MPANFLHGVETIEIDKGPRPIRVVKTAVVGLVGTAPIWEVDPADRKINEPVLILNERDGAKYFGTMRPGYTIPYALDAIFDHGAGIVIAVNVFDPNVHKTSVSNVSKTFGTDDKIQLDHIGIVEGSEVVKSVDGLTTYQRNTDYTIDYKTGVITRLSTGAIPAGATVKIDYAYADPSKVQPSDIIGTTTTDGKRTGMKALLDSFNLFGFDPKILIAPGYSTLNSVSSEMISLAHRLRAIALIDAPAGATVQQVIAGRGPNGTINFNTSSERAVLCYPHLKVYDIATNTERLEPFSQRLAGVICKTDIEKGYWWSPSNQELMGIIGTERPITARINDPNTEANLLNENGIVTVFNSFGTGFRVWGNRSAAWPTNTHPKNFINVRRVADVIHESIEYAMLQFIDQPINDALIDAIVESVNAFLRTLVMRGAIIDGKCTFNKEKNPPTEIANGHLTFDIEFMPPPPAERITFESFINIELLKKLGGR